MTQAIENAVKVLKDLLQREAGADVVRVSVHISFSESLIEETSRTAESLRADGISMRNIRGNWIV